MAPRRSRAPGWGRQVVAAGLAATLVVLSVVAWRRSVGIAEARMIRKIELDRRALVSERITLERDIRDAMSGPRITRDAARRLGMVVARETQLRTVVVPSLDGGVPGEARP